MDDETKLGIMILMSFVIFIFLLILIMKIMIHWGNSQQKELVIENKKKNRNLQTPSKEGK